MRPEHNKDCTKDCERIAYCETCGKRKSPRGRSAPMEMRCCDWDCPGYEQDPHPGHLWPGELAQMDEPDEED